MHHLTESMFREAIAALPAEFHTRAIIDHFYRLEQVAYVDELHASRSVGTYPFTETHRQIGQALHGYADLIEKVGDGNEEDRRHDHRGSPHRRRARGRARRALQRRGRGGRRLAADRGANLAELRLVHAPSLGLLHDRDGAVLDD